MKTIYTLISYKPGDQGYIDRCGDFNRGEESECTIQYFDNPKDASTALGHTQFHNSQGENIFLINGLNPDDCYSILSDEEGKELKNQFFEIDDAAFQYRQKLSEEHQLQLEAAKQKKIQEEQLRKRKEQKILENQERAQLAKLLKKYSN
jgi:hypothetical protein